MSGELAGCHDDDRRCVIGEKPHWATRGLLCQQHFEQLGTMLRQVEDEAIHLEIRPSVAIKYDRSGGGLASQQWPVRPDPLVLTDRRRGTGMTIASENDEIAWDDVPSAVETLHSRARTVREERNLTTPEVTVILGRSHRPAGLAGPVCDRFCGHESCGPWITDTVRQEAMLTVERDLLTRQLPWIAEQLWVDEFYDELRDLLTALQRANHSLQVPAGTCNTLIPDGTLCDGKVWHVLIHPDGKVADENHPASPDDEPGFRCGRCKRVWTGTDAVRQRDRMWRDEQENRHPGTGGSAA